MCACRGYACQGGHACLGGVHATHGPSPVDRMTDRYKNTTFPQLRFREVEMILRGSLYSGKINSSSLGDGGKRQPIIWPIAHVKSMEIKKMARAGASLAQP